MSNEPQTLGEVIRRVDSIERRQEQANDIYLRKDVYLADQRTDNARWKDHDKDHDGMAAERSSDLSFRRQVLLWGAGLTITSLVTVALFVASLIGKV